MPMTIASSAMTLPPPPYPRLLKRDVTKRGNRKAPKFRRKAQAAEAEAEYRVYVSAM